jgi:hypothetical protein
LGPLYHRAEFEVRVIIGSTDLKFQLWGKNRQLSKNHEQIEVQWVATGAPDSPSMEITRDIFGLWKI